MIDNGTMSIQNVAKTNNRTEPLSFVLATLNEEQELGPSILTEDKVSGAWEDEQGDI